MSPYAAAGNIPVRAKELHQAIIVKVGRHPSHPHGKRRDNTAPGRDRRRLWRPGLATELTHQVGVLAIQLAGSTGGLRRTNATTNTETIAEGQDKLLPASIRSSLRHIVMQGPCNFFVTLTRRGGGLGVTELERLAVQRHGTSPQHVVRHHQTPHAYQIVLEQQRTLPGVITLARVQKHQVKRTALTTLTAIAALDQERELAVGFALAQDYLVGVLGAIEEAARNGCSEILRGQRPRILTYSIQSQYVEDF